jgi:hypothetical protein
MNFIQVIGIVLLTLIAAPIINDLWHKIKFIFYMRKVIRDLEGEPKAKAKEKAGEWRDD